MAEPEAQQMTYVPETILKKRKKIDELAILRRKQLELGKYGMKKNKKQLQVADIKRPEQLIKQFRDQELDLVRLKQRAKGPKSSFPEPTSNLLFVIRIQGKSEMHPKTKKILYSLRLRKIFSGVFVKPTQCVLEMLRKVEPYITYGCPNLKSVRDLINKKGYARIDKKVVPLTDNNIVEQIQNCVLTASNFVNILQALGKYGIICVEDIVNQVVNVGPHFKEVISFMGPLILSKPAGDAPGNKRPYKEGGGDAGNREDAINDLISKMN